MKRFSIYFWRALIKLFTKEIIAKTPVANIIVTLIIERHLPSLIADFSGINKPTSAINVTNTAIWAIILFSFFIPLLQNSRIQPKKRGINAVNDNDSLSEVASKVKYAQSGINIKAKELIVFAWYAFIVS